MTTTSKPNPNHSYQITYRDFCDERHAASRQEEMAYREYIAQRFIQIAKAVDIASDETERRLDLLNEFRAQSVDEQKRFAHRDVIDAQLRAMEERISSNERWRANMDGRLAVGLILLGLLGIGLRFVQ